MTYQLTTSGTILRLKDEAFIPPDPANTDYAEYQQWLAAGNTPCLPLPHLPHQSHRLPSKSWQQQGSRWRS